MESRVSRKRIRGSGNERSEDQKRSKRINGSENKRNLRSEKIKEDQRIRNEKSEDQKRSKRSMDQKIKRSSLEEIKIRRSEDREMK